MDGSVLYFHFFGLSMDGLMDRWTDSNIDVEEEPKKERNG